MQARGFVLIGGGSRRMGADKASLVLEGKTFLQRAIQVFQAVGIEPTLVGDRPASQVLDQVSTLPDRFPAAGPLSGIYSALMSSKSELNFFLPCDMPLAEPELLKALESSARSSADWDVVVPQDRKGRLHLVAACYSLRCRQPFRKRLEEGKLKLGGILEDSQIRVRLMQVSQHGIEDACLTNVNSREDYLKLTRNHHRQNQSSVDARRR